MKLYESLSREDAMKSSQYLFYRNKGIKYRIILTAILVIAGGLTLFILPLMKDLFILFVIIWIGAGCGCLVLWESIRKYDNLMMKILKHCGSYVCYVAQPQHIGSVFEEVRKKTPFARIPGGLQYKAVSQIRCRYLLKTKKGEKVVFSIVHKGAGLSTEDSLGLDPITMLAAGTVPITFGPREPKEDVADPKQSIVVGYSESLNSVLTFQKGKGSCIVQMEDRHKAGD